MDNRRAAARMPPSSLPLEWLHRQAAHCDYRMLDRTNDRTSHARRWLTPCCAQTRATAFRLTSGVTIFCNDILQDRNVQHGLGEQLLQLGILVLERLQLAGIGHIHATILRLVFAEGFIRDAVFAADINRLRARLLLLQNPEDLFSRAPFIHPSP